MADNEDLRMLKRAVALLREHAQRVGWKDPLWDEIIEMEEFIKGRKQSFNPSIAEQLLYLSDHLAR